MGKKKFIFNRNMFLRFLKEHNIYYQFLGYGSNHMYSDTVGNKMNIKDYLSSPCKYYNKFDNFQLNYLFNAFSWQLFERYYTIKYDMVTLNLKWIRLFKKVNGLPIIN